MKKQEEVQRTLILDGRILSYTVTRRRMRSIRARIKPDGGICVSAPDSLSFREIETFLLSHRVFLLRGVEKAMQIKENSARLCDGGRVLEAGEWLTLRVLRGRSAVRREGNVLSVTLPHPDSEGSIRRLLFSHYRSLCELRMRERLPMAFSYYATRGIVYPTVSYRAMRSRWGSCAKAKAHITLNILLACLPPSCFDYVLAHECAHLIEANHSSSFYRLLACTYPSYRREQETLRAMAPYAMSHLSPKT